MGSPLTSELRASRGGVTRDASVPPLPRAGEGRGEGLLRRSLGMKRVRADGLHSESEATRPLILTFSREREKGRRTSRLLRMRGGA